MATITTKAHVFIGLFKENNSLYFIYNFFNSNVSLFTKKKIKNFDITDDILIFRQSFVVFN